VIGSPWRSWRYVRDVGRAGAVADLGGLID
jgi:hypothetical protein